MVGSNSTSNIHKDNLQLSHRLEREIDIDVDE